MVDYKFTRQSYYNDRVEVDVEYFNGHYQTVTVRGDFGNNVTLPRYIRIRMLGKETITFNLGTPIEEIRNECGRRLKSRGLPIPEQLVL